MCARRWTLWTQANNLLRKTIFTNDGQFSLNTMESSGYVQDRWMPVQRVVIEPGVRWDRDSFLQRDFYSPRIAGSALLERAHETKFTAGIGVYYDRSNLSMVSQALQGDSNGYVLLSHAEGDSGPVCC